MNIKILSTVALIAFSFVSSYAADAGDQKQFEKSMKELGRITKGFRDNTQAKNAAAVEKDSARVAEIYQQMAAFWKGRHVDDATKWSEQSAAAATATAAAAKAGDWDKVKSSWGTVNKSCKDCHDAHRQKLPEGGYKIK
jgi:cytochrome c556